MITLHLARADNGVIGRAGRLPWHLPADLARFRAQTMGKPMIMGRKTFESLPGLLPGRRHIVLTRDGAWSTRGVAVARSVDEALSLAGPGDIAVIGGAVVFASFLDRAACIQLTEIHGAPEGDVRVPPFAGWREQARQDIAAAPPHPAYSFVTLVRA